jgi:5,5'-dehydrodivanillate O-demethylase
MVHFRERITRGQRPSERLATRANLANFPSRSLPYEKQHQVRKPGGIMLNEETNRLLTEVGAGTPGGELLRRYWHPIAALSELDEQPTKRVRLLGEDLVLYRDGAGHLGLIEEACPHRSASMYYAFPDDCGIRCMYHGWLFAPDGQCLEQPNEPADSTFHEKVRAVAYPVQALGGLVFAYLGPAPAPLLPHWDLSVWNEGVVKQIGSAVIPCNWFQIMENTVDPVHAEWLHGRYFQYVLDRQGAGMFAARFDRKHIKIGFDRFDYGIIKRRVLEGQSEADEDWSVGHPLVFPNFLKVGGNRRHEFMWRVPIDDTNTLHIWYQVLEPGPGITIPPQDRIGSYTWNYLDGRGEFAVDTVNGQDIAAWVTQGKITNRTRERLGTADRGVVLYRQMMREEIEKVQRGEDPLGTIRDPAINERITLPLESGDKLGTGSEPSPEYLRRIGYSAETNDPAFQAVIEQLTARALAQRS